MKKLKVNLNINKEELKKKLDIRDGIDGVSPNIEDVALEASKLVKVVVPTVEDIAEDLPKMGERIRDGLEILSGDERLEFSAIKDSEKILEEIKEAKKSGTTTAGWGAHPLTIQESGVTKRKNARTLNFTGGTVTESVDGTTNISTGGNINISDPDPTGQEGLLTINSTTGILKVYYNGFWQTLHVLADAVYYYSTEGGDYYLLEDGTSKYLLE